MFERPHHRRIAEVLLSLDADLLRREGCLFGGGTAMALRFGEYRESVDIDFLISDLPAYRRLRNALTGAQRLRPIMRTGAVPAWEAGEVRGDQYGIRAQLALAGVPIKLEIVLEGRIELETPGAKDQVSGIATLTGLDMATSKLLANSDRWGDDGIFNRDLIDLAMMKPPLALLRAAVAKAETAYGPAVLRDLGKAIARVHDREGWLDRCMQVMQMNVPRALVWQRIRALKRVLA